jgi:hypothetical protein
VASCYHKEPKSKKESKADQEKLKGVWYTVISKDGAKHEDGFDAVRIMHQYSH